MPTALVTGCSTGIGFATALRLAEDGHQVVATMRRPDRDGGPLRDAAAASGLDVRLDELDVTDDASVRRAFDAVGPLDVLVNNAGVMWFGSVEETGVERWQEVFDTNLFGAVRCMRAALPLLRARGGGCIVNVSSAAGSVAMPAGGAYSASKAALESVSEVLAIEGRAHGIRVVIVGTGATATPISDKTAPPSRDSPYWAAMKNTLVFLAGQAPFSPPSVIADAIADAVRDPATPLRIAVGKGSTELFSMRAAMGDDEWIATAGGPTAGFAGRLHEITGVDLRR